MKVQTTQAYKCLYCSKISLSIREIEIHQKTCRKNPEYIQKCIQCVCLNDDFILSNLRGKGFCIHTSPFSKGCPYFNHDDTEVRQKIQKSHDAYIKYSCYSSDISPQKNWEREENYDKLRENGYSSEKAKAEVYGIKKV